MSGAALAYEALDTDYDPIVHHRQPKHQQSQTTGQYKLLGGADTMAAPARPTTIEDDDVIRYINRAAVRFAKSQHESNSRPAEQVITFHTPAAVRGGSTARAAKLRFLLSSLCVLVFLGIATPALAAALSRGGQDLHLSGYTDQASRKKAPADQVAVPQGGSSPSTNNTPPEQKAQAQQPAPSGEAGKYELTGPPSTSVQQIERVLQQYGSPAVGNGQTLYNLGVKYGIDPAYALAFFVHESGCGTKGVARFTKSLGNIRWTEGFGNYEGYRSYNSWADGMEDWYKLITDLYIGGWNLRTVDAIIPVYAPWGDNNHPPTYIASIKNMVDSWRGK